MAQLRREPLTGRWVILSPERGDRPNAFGAHAEASEIDCPFCPGREDQTPPEIDRVGSPDWVIRVVPNLFPAVGTKPPSSSDDEPASGRHEVIIESPSHNGCFDEYEESHAIDVVRMWMDRCNVLASDPGARVVVLFHNRGRGAGASMTHPHSQVISLPFLPPRLATQQESFGRSRHCLLCHSSNRVRESSLMIRETRDFVALAPYGSRFPHQVWVHPVRHQAQIGQMDEAEAKAFASILKDIVRTIRACFDDPPFNWAFHQEPVASDGKFHWFLEIIPRLTAIAGYEIATETYINVVEPEETARILRGRA